MIKTIDELHDKIDNVNQNVIDNRKLKESIDAQLKELYEIQTHHENNEESIRNLKKQIAKIEALDGQVLARAEEVQWQK